MDKAKSKKPKLRFKEFFGEWKSQHLFEIAQKIQDGTHFSPKIDENGEYLYLTSKNIKNGYIELSNAQLISKEAHENIYKRCDVQKGDVLITKDGTIGQTCINNIYEPFSLLSSVAFIRTNNKTDNYFLYHLISSPIGQRVIENTIAGQALKRITLTKINNYKYYFPTTLEQQKIASFLTAVDDKIQHLIKKKELLGQYKKGVMQKIFSQELRFKIKNRAGELVEPPDWAEKKLGKFLIHKSVRNIELNIKRVLSVNNKKGFITQKEQFDGHSVASKDLSNYKIVKKNDIAYNPSRINVGSIAMLINFEEGIVSPMYVVFTLNNSMDKVFFMNLIITHYFKYLIKVGCSGSVRDSLNFNDMANFNIKLPCFNEQHKIANFLTGIDKKIELINAQLKKTQQFKKGLLQQMFV